MKSIRKNIELELINGLRKENHQSFKRLFEFYSQPLYKFSFSYLKSKEAAEDVVQEVFFKIWNNKKDIKTNTSFQSYLFTIALNSIRKHFNKLSKQNDLKHNILNTLSTDQQNFDDNSNYQDLLNKLEKLIERMPERRKQVFVKMKLEEKSQKEIAEELSITTKTVEYHIMEAMKFLRKEFEKLGDSGLIFFYIFIQPQSI